MPVAEDEHSFGLLTPKLRRCSEQNFCSTYVSAWGSGKCGSSLTVRVTVRLFSMASFCPPNIAGTPASWVAAFEVIKFFDQDSFQGQ